MWATRGDVNEDARAARLSQRQSPQRRSDVADLLRKKRRRFVFARLREETQLRSLGKDPPGPPLPSPSECESVPPLPVFLAPRLGRLCPTAACTLEGRHSEPPRRVGTPSALRVSAMAWSVMPRARIPAMRSL